MTYRLASSANRIGATARSRMALLWLVLALLCQGFVTQTHQHFGGDPAWKSISVTAAADSRKQAPATPACPICEEKALFGAYLLGGSVTLALPVDVAVAYTAPAFSPFALPLASPAWRSRAPPASTI